MDNQFLLYNAKTSIANFQGTLSTWAFNLKILFQQQIITFMTLRATINCDSTFFPLF